MTGNLKLKTSDIAKAESAQAKFRLVSMQRELSEARAECNLLRAMLSAVTRDENDGLFFPNPILADCMQHSGLNIEQIVGKRGEGEDEEEISGLRVTHIKTENPDPTAPVLVVPGANGAK